MTVDAELELRCINTIRAVSADQPEAAKSGHPGAPMGCAPMAYLLFGEIMKYSGKDPLWMNRDRFVLSNGHACALQYTMLHLTGYNLSIDDLKKFRQVGSKTPGHPEWMHTEGVEVCTGPLGQGISNAVGLAISEKHMAATFNEPSFPIFDHYTYVICGDGCMQEGVSSEACSLAGHLGLGRLIVLYDDNGITIDGETDLSFTENVLHRFEAYGWHTQEVTDVQSNVDSLRKAILAAQQVTDKPSLIKIKTHIGYGSPSKQGSEKAHGAPLGADDLAGAKKFYGLPSDKSFFVPSEVQEYFHQASAKAETKRHDWEALFAKFAEKYPDKAAEISRRYSKKLPDNIFDDLPVFTFGKDKDMATRGFSQLCLQSLGSKMPELVGGSADLTGSNLTDYKGLSDFQRDNHQGRYLRFGVREHAMVAICNGMFAYGGLRPYCGTFLTFFGYAAGAIRVTALSKFGVIFVFTHDSIGLGEDGPTHQPIETLESLRCIPNLLTYRPADGNETSAAYKVAITRHETPTVIACSRQTLPSLACSSLEKACHGAYVAVDVTDPALVLIGTGSEVGLCVDAAKILQDSGIPTRVVSMPCQEVFLEQKDSYQREVLPGNIPTMSVEAAAIHGWHRFSHAQIGMTSFGLSGPGPDLFKHFGFTVDNIVAKGTALVEFYKTAGSVPDLNSRPSFDTMSTNGSAH